MILHFFVLLVSHINSDIHSHSIQFDSYALYLVSHDVYTRQSPIFFPILRALNPLE